MKGIMKVSAFKDLLEIHFPDLDDKSSKLLMNHLIDKRGNIQTSKLEKVLNQKSSNQN
jgi:hypothetical protein